MKRQPQSRRELLLKSAALGSLILVPTLSFDEALWGWNQSEQKPRKPTAWDEIGPFYKRDAPNSVQLRRPGDPGLPLRVSGRVFDTRGNVLSGAKVEVWQTNHRGVYDLDGYSYRSTLIADASGQYGFQSVMPGHYRAASASTSTIWSPRRWRSPAKGLCLPRPMPIRRCAFTTRALAH